MDSQTDLLQDFDTIEQEEIGEAEGQMVEVQSRKEELRAGERSERRYQYS